jgi:hypothetical protein
MTATARPISSRVIGWLRFVLVVWAVALAFLGFAAAVQYTFAWAAARGSIDPALLIAKADADCAKIGEQVIPAQLEPAAVRATIWRLGLNLGVAAGLRNANSATPAGLSEMSADRAVLAHQLGVPSFEIPPLIHPAEAFHEFGIYLQGDRDCIAARLSKMYTPRNGALFQFAAVAGHNWVYGSLAPQMSPIFVPELTVYGARAEIPASIWARLTTRPSNLSVEEARQQLSDAIGQIGLHLAPSDR